MTDQELLGHIIVDPRIMVGKPVVRGIRLTVEYILNLLAHGSTVADILEEYDDVYDGLVAEEIQACLLFAAWSLEDTAFMPLAVDEA